MTLVPIFAVRLGERKEKAGGEERQLFTVARRRLSRHFSAAPLTLNVVMRPWALGARLSQPSSARILHGSVRLQWWAASVSQRRGWVRGENETGGGACAETLYDALITGRLFLLACPWSSNQNRHIHLALLPQDSLEAANRCPHSPPSKHTHIITVFFSWVLAFTSLMLLLLLFLFPGSPLTLHRVKTQG